MSGPTHPTSCGTYEHRRRAAWGHHAVTSTLPRQGSQKASPAQLITGRPAAGRHTFGTRPLYEGERAMGVTAGGAQRSMARSGDVQLPGMTKTAHNLQPLNDPYY
ncbi:hypothetical protein GWK47_005044 [Chionoecetes opilio]|uniref:Uncharacterized protein n=1 Tax=Chionoecetes opilio TaxID=41210 RepID=A0A8J4YJH5_CHIOP|nr:hypothetical protein GWK47_005044 [Chionoecetes opilio]